MGGQMKRFQALLQGIAVLMFAIMATAAAGLLIRVFLWSAGL